MHVLAWTFDACCHDLNLPAWTFEACQLDLNPFVHVGVDSVVNLTLLMRKMSPMRAAHMVC